MEMTTKHLMEVMDSSGDTKIIWDPNNEHEVGCARQTFDKLREKGFQAWTVKPNGETDKRIDTFDPQLKAIIMVPRVVGG